MTILFQYRLETVNRRTGREYHDALALANVGEENLILRVGGSPELRKHLEDLGFTPGGTATVVAAMGGNIIVKIKESRVAISEEMARKIMI